MIPPLKFPVINLWMEKLGDKGGKMVNHPVFHTDPECIPAEPGAYLLLIALARPLPVNLPGKGGAVLAAGRYLYCGSARGPGGLKARLARHMRRDKSPHWHVDRLTAAGETVGAWILPGGDECAVAARLGHLPAPLPGFGSSDCRRCVSHLRFWPEGTAMPFTLPDRTPACSA